MARHTSNYPLYLLFALLPLTALAEPVVNTRSVYYEINGNTAPDLWEDIKRKTPVQQDGRWHVAYTKWDVNWRFWWLDKADACEITRVETTLDVVYTLPRLSSAATLPDTLSHQWEQYYAALLAHEEGHKAIGLQAAIEIERAISAMESETTCSKLERAANKTASDLIGQYSRIEKDYDRTTRHGRNTGVVFPLVNAAN